MPLNFTKLLTNLLGTIAHAKGAPDPNARVKKTRDEVDTWRGSATDNAGQACPIPLASPVAAGSVCQNTGSLWTFRRGSMAGSVEEKETATSRLPWKLSENETAPAAMAILSRTVACCGTSISTTGYLAESDATARAIVIGAGVIIAGFGLKNMYELAVDLARTASRSGQNVSLA